MRKMLRRGAMLALVLILLLSHTMGALAISPKEPSVIVNSYGWLYSEIVGAQSGDVIGIRGTILIPSGAILDAGYRDIELRRMDIGAKLVFAGDPDHSIETKINSFIFNGNAPNVGGDDAFIEVNGTAVFDGCTFYDCYNGEGGIGGAMYIASGDVTIHNCDFKSCSAKYGSHIYTDVTHAVIDHVDEDDRVNSKTQGQNVLELGQRGGWLINESGLYSLILSSKLPTAKKFKHWVTAEVLPSIRKRGKCYPYEGESA